MAVLFSTGFGANNLTGDIWLYSGFSSYFDYKKKIQNILNNGLDTIGFTVQTGGYSAYNYPDFTQVSITNDSYMPNRHVLKISHDTSSNTKFPLFGLVIKNTQRVEDTEGLILGFTFKMGCNLTTPPSIGATPNGKYGLMVCRGDITPAGRTDGTTLLSNNKDCFFNIGNGSRTGDDDGPSFPLVLFKNGILVEDDSSDKKYTGDSLHHFEMIIEKNKRVRCYIDGNLATDNTYTGDIKTALEGLSICSWKAFFKSSSYILSDYNEIGNIYMLAIDDVHNSRLGPSTRVVDYAVTKDVKAQFKNSNPASKGNYEIAAQNLDEEGHFLTSSGDGPVIDLYQMPKSITSEAAKIHGASLRVTCVNPSQEDSFLSPVIGTGGNEYKGDKKTVDKKTNTLTLDVSVNPTTSKKWTVEDFVDSSIGMESTKQ